MSQMLLVEFEDQNGKSVSDKMQVPSMITEEQLKSLISTTLTLYVNGTPMLATLQDTVSSLGINIEETVIIRTTKEEPATQAATFCSSSFSGHEGPVLCLRYDEMLVTGGSDGTVRFWDVRTKTQTKIIKKHNHWVLCLDISPCKQYVVSGSVDGELKFFSRNGDFIRSFIGHRSSVLSIKFVGKQIVSSSRDKSVKIFDYDGKCIFSYGHSKPVTCLAAHEQTIVSGSRDGRIKVYDNSNLKDLNGHSTNINCIDIKGVYMASGSDDGSVVIWKNCMVYKRLKHEREVLSVSLSANLIYLASGSFDKSVRLWSVETGKMITKYLHVDFIYKVSLLNDLIISSSKDKTIKMYRISKKKVIRNLVCDDEIYCFDYYDNQLVCGSKSGKVYFYN